MIDLSTYYPPGTVYFYSFPSGEDSGFFNGVPAWKEELVAARSLICAGKNVKVVTFSPSTDPAVRHVMCDALGVEMIDPGQIMCLPTEINANVQGDTRNAMIKESLKTMVPDGKLIMGQPFLDKDLESKYQISPELVITLNDKINRTKYVPAEYLPKQFHVYSNGVEAAADTCDFPFPCVFKVTSSSSGDGVRICRTLEDLEKAKAAFKHIQGTIIIEEYIETQMNLGIQFGIPHDANQPIEVIGYNEQLTSDQGDYLGGIVHPSKTLPELDQIYAVLKNDILPTVRQMGWYGVGGIDVLVNKEGKFYFIDPNFRMTAAFTYVYLTKNKKVDRPLVSFTGVFTGTEEAFLKTIAPIATERTPEQRMTIIALTKKGDSYNFNAGMFFDEPADIPGNARALLDLGIDSTVLTRISNPS